MSGRTDGRIKIAHLITDSGVGGAEKILYELVTRLDPAKFASRVIVMKKPGRTAEMLMQAGARLTSLGFPSVAGPGYVFHLPAATMKLWRELRADPPDVLHCWLFQANMMGRLLAKPAGIRANISSLRVMEMERTFQYPADRLTRRLVTRYVAVCEAVAAHYLQKLGVPSEKMLVIRNGITAEGTPSVDKGAARQEMGIGPDAPVIGIMGRLHRQKGIDVLLAALPSLAEAHPGLVVLMAGDGPERKALEAGAETVGASAEVRFLGEWRRVPEFMAALDVFVLPSRWEGMPNAVLEAMAAGVCVVASNVGGVPELVGTGGPDETGIMTPAGDADALATAVGALLADEKRREAMADNARRRVRREFSIERMVSSHAALYRELSSGA